MGNYMEIDGDVKWFVSKERGGGVIVSVVYFMILKRSLV